MESKETDKKGKFDYLNENLFEQYQTRPPLSFRQNLKKAIDDACFIKFFGTCRELHFLHLLDIL